MTPVQKPHPPLWYGVAKPEGAAWPAQNKVNIVTSVPGRPGTDDHPTPIARPGPPPATRPPRYPLIGMSRHIVIAETDAAALAIARRGYQRWHASFMKLWIKHGAQPLNAVYPDNFDALQDMGLGVAGAPDTVRAVLSDHVEVSGINYLACRFAFGDLSFEESQRSLELFTRAVMPTLRRARADGQLEDGVSGSFEPDIPGFRPPGNSA